MSPGADVDAKAAVLEVIAAQAKVAVEELRPETELVAGLGIDSARALQLLVAIEDRLGVEIDDDEIAGLNTVGDVLAAIEGGRASSG